MRSTFCPLALCAGLCLAGAALAQQPPPPPASMQPPPPGRAGATTVPGAPGATPGPGRPAAPPDAAQQGTAPSVSGRLQRWLVNPGGQVDGLLLADGTQVLWPPHLSTSVLQALKPGDTVQVSGWRVPNAPVLRAVQLTAGGRTVQDTPPSPGSAPPARVESSALTAMSASGRVAQLLYTARGDTHGVLLDSGAIVRFPPHVGAAMAASLQPGSTLFARGWGSRSPQGEALEATALGPSADAARDLFAGPGVEPPLPGPRRGHPPTDPKGPNGPKGPKGHPAHGAGPVGPAAGVPGAPPDARRGGPVAPPAPYSPDAPPPLPARMAPAAPPMS